MELIRAVFGRIAEFVESLDREMFRGGKRNPLTWYEQKVLAKAALVPGSRGSSARFIRQASPEDVRAAIRAIFIAMPTTMCVTLPESLLAAQDALLQHELAASTVVDCAALPRVCHEYDVCVWQGDMSHLKCDAVVNPANGQLMGCFFPTHKCLDNILHAQSGPRLRIACRSLMTQLGLEEDANGNCRVTPAFMLPSKHVMHTVGPCLIFNEKMPPRPPTEVDRKELKQCYLACLESAKQLHATSIAFCCISTGVFGYPADEGATVALRTVKGWLDDERKSGNLANLRVIFNVFKDDDLAIYNRLAPQIFVAQKGATDAPPVADASPSA